MLTEAKCVSKLVDALSKLPGFVVFKHFDPITSGVPDVSVTGRSMTTWLEVKFANPTIIDRELQRLTMRKLNASGSAYYVIFYADDTVAVRRPGFEWNDPAGEVVRGPNVNVVVAFIRRTHE